MIILATKRVGLWERRWARVASGDYSQLLALAVNEAVRDVTERIDRGVDVDGRPFPPNSPRTAERKAREGKAPVPLVDEGRLRSPRTYVRKVEKARAEVRRSASVVRKGKVVSYDVAYWWMDKYRFWGVSAEALARIVRRVRQWLRSV